MTTCTRGGRWGLVRASHGELELMAMADVHGVVACSHMVVAVAVKRAAVVVSTTYGDDGPRWGEVGGAMMVVGHG